ncbi:MAG: L-threonylcarbamoyladenylate synthase [Bacteroidota bacterium]
MDHLFSTKIGTELEPAIHFLSANEVVAIPTETVYGLAANALSENAVLKIFEAKNRPHFNPLIVHIKDWKEASNYAETIPALLSTLAEKFCPGPITFLVPKKDCIPDLVTAGSPYVALRVPNHPLCLSLLQLLPFPLAAPSANPFGYVSPVTAAHVLQGLDGKIPYILDGGTCTIGLESTIVSVDQHKVVVHRVGGISVEAIAACINDSVEIQTHNEQAPTTAGQLKSHYATHTPLIIGDPALLYKEHAAKKIGIIAFSNTYEALQGALVWTLSPQHNLSAAAANLFRALREADAYGLDLIIAERFPDQDLGRAINDRLHRAQALFK